MTGARTSSWLAQLARTVLLLLQMGKVSRVQTQVGRKCRACREGIQIALLAREVSILLVIMAPSDGANGEEQRSGSTRTKDHMAASANRMPITDFLLHSHPETDVHLLNVLQVVDRLC